MTSEKLTPIETPKQNGKEEQQPQKPFDPIEQRIEWSIDLINTEYKIKFWKDLPNDIKNLLSKSLNWKNQEERDSILDDITIIIQDSDNPTDDLKYILESYIWEQTENSNEQTKTERNENRDYLISSATQLKNSISNLDLNWKDKNHVDIVQRIQNLEFNKTGSIEEDKALKKEIDLILSTLKSNPETLTAIALDLKNQDPQAYNDFCSALVSLDSDFRSILPPLETRAKLALWNDTLQGATIKGKEITQTTKDGYTTTAKLDWTDRTLWLSDSQFKLKSTLDSDKQAQAEADRIEKDLHDQLEPLGKKFQSLDAIKTHLETITNQNTDINISDIKAEIKTFAPELYTELWLENLNTLAEIKTAINTYTTKLTQERDEIEKRAKKELDNLTQIHKQKLAEKQEVQKIILEILHKIGFDRIPQAVINLIIAKVNQNPAMFWFEKPLDFENGSIWFNKINGLTIQKFIKFSNGVISWNAEFPSKYTNWHVTFHETEENAKASILAPSTFEIWEFVNRNLWINPSQTALMNLDKANILKDN